MYQRDLNRRFGEIVTRIQGSVVDAIVVPGPIKLVYHVPNPGRYGVEHAGLQIFAQDH
jgi:hypothetical protein